MGFVFFPDILMAAGEMVRDLRAGGKMVIWRLTEKNSRSNTWTNIINGPLKKPWILRIRRNYFSVQSRDYCAGSWNRILEKYPGDGGQGQTGQWVPGFLPEKYR
jgi:hypothetical protein